MIELSPMTNNCMIDNPNVNEQNNFKKNVGNTFAFWVLIKVFYLGKFEQIFNSNWSYMLN